MQSLHDLNNTIIIIDNSPEFLLIDAIILAPKSYALVSLRHEIVHFAEAALLEGMAERATDLVIVSVVHAQRHESGDQIHKGNTVLGLFCRMGWV